jgi:hypothetical protein
LIVLLRLLQFCSGSTVRLREPMFLGDRNRLFNDEMTGALLNRLPQWSVDRNDAFC